MLSPCLASAQQPSPQAACNLSLVQAPVIGCFRLGMTVEDLKKCYPDIEAEKPDAWDIVKIELDAHGNARRSTNIQYALRNDGAASLSFHNNKLIDFAISSGVSVQVGIQEAYLQGLSDRYKLPFAWAADNDDPGMMSCDCHTFIVSVSTSVSAIIGVTDSQEWESLKQRWKDSQKESLAPRGRF